MRRPNLDWESIRERLRASETALAEDLAGSPARIAAAYKKRAARLANPESRVRSISSAQPMLIFRLAGERYAVALKELSEVAPLRNCTPVPGAAAEFRGVMNLRGEVRSVVDLRRLLIPSAAEAAEPGVVLMVRRPGREIGLRIDQVEELREVPGDSISRGAQGKYVNGTVSGTILLLDMDAVLKTISEQG